MNGWRFHTDGVHLNSRGAMIVADHVQEFIDEEQKPLDYGGNSGTRTQRRPESDGIRRRERIPKWRASFNCLAQAFRCE
jgi:hypothetical protein